MTKVILSLSTVFVVWLYFVSDKNINGRKTAFILYLTILYYSILGRQLVATW